MMNTDELEHQIRTGNYSEEERNLIRDMVPLIHAFVEYGHLSKDHSPKNDKSLGDKRDD